MTPTQRIIQDLAQVHSVDAETIVRAAVVDLPTEKDTRRKLRRFGPSRILTHRMVTKNVTRRRKW